ncbi:hypothetical protein [Streptomyces sp. TLI_185]|uniref:hypothetical protein n=1 Tax=Streptomyces sp. TLI_185 TaxID=2485151 RepID=UPI000F4F7939|nr:hypothetical protein [Streptomyces sp. TLI_185]RPF33108.1 hypothetical protein EDD92_3009 [Streptomyces sp. TLI_185]
MTGGHKRGRAWAIFSTSVALAFCGAAWMASAWADTHRPGVSVHREEKSPEEIRKYWTPERIRQAEPAEMPVVHPCDGLKSALHPSCW